ncbi:MAG TPA: AI-2E family transporter, partial [Rhodopila sp.]|nr:AI-2E family transporter [Rhodopila sp.]
RVKHAFTTLLEDLNEYEDKEPKHGKSEDAATAPPRSEQDVPKHPPPGGATPETLPPAWRGEHPVLCIAGRGPLDDAASAMLAQLLHKNGLNARIVSHRAAERTTIGSLDVTDVAMICLCYLELSGTPSHLRYLLKRLRQHAPNARLLVGLWPIEQQILVDDRLRSAVGADYYTSSLRETVEACLEAARAEVTVAA